MNQSLPKLEAPGKGLGFIPTLIARYLLMPRWSRTFDWKKISDLFNSETEKIIKLVETIPPEQWVHKKLVGRLQGLEDSSRYWSVADTLEHLVIVGRHITHAAQELSSGRELSKVPRVEDVKPTGHVEALEIFEEFKSFSRSINDRCFLLSKFSDSKLLGTHPWFGPLNHRQWMIVLAIHQRIHRKQIEAIKTLLP